MKEVFDYIEKMAKQKWLFYHSKNPLTKLLLFISRQKKVKVIWIQQHDAGNWENAHCKGNVIRSWQYDNDGMKDVEQIGEVDSSKIIASTTPIISFYVDETLQKMIYNDWHGKLAGGGYVLQYKDGDWSAPENSPSWKS